MTESPDTKTTPPPGWWARARNDVQERIDGILELVGAIAFAIGGWRQVFFAIALCCLASGLGICLEHGIDYAGHRWMGIGGFVFGLVWPLKKQG